MQVLENAFVIIHIKLSDVRLGLFKARTLANGVFILLLLLGAKDMYVNLVINPNIWGFIETAIYLIVVIYVVFYWIKTWSLAYKMLNKAAGYEKEMKEAHV